MRGRLHHAVSVLVLAAAFGLAHAYSPANAQVVDAGEAVEFLQLELGLTDEQAVEVGGAVAQFAGSVKAAQEEQEAAEESDGMAMMADIKAARGVYQEQMQGILTAEQWEEYQALADATMNEIYQEIALLKIQDLQQPLQLSETQEEELQPIVATGMRQMVGTVYEFSDKRMSVPNKLKMANALKKAKNQMDSGMKQVLTPEQWAQVEAMREEKKQEKKNK